MGHETVTKALDMGMQISQTYKEDFTGFLIFMFVVAISILGVIFCGIAWTLYKGILYNTRRNEQREEDLSRSLEEIRKTATTLSATNTELTRINSDLVRTNTELVKNNSEVCNAALQKLDSLNRIEHDIDEIKTNLVVISSNHPQK